MSFVALVFSQDSIGVPDYDNPTIIYQYDRHDSLNNNPANGLIPLKSLEASGKAYMTNQSFTFNHVTSDIQWNVPDDGFIRISYMLASRYATDAQQQTLQNGGTVWYDLMAMVKSDKGYNSCGWWPIFHMSKKVNNLDEEGDGVQLIQVKKGNVIAFGRNWSYQSLPGAIVIVYYPIKKTRIYN